MSSSTSTTTTTTRSINVKLVLQAIEIVVGQSPVSKDKDKDKYKIGQPKPTLSSILRSRLRQLDQLELELELGLGLGLEGGLDDDSEEEFELERLTGETSLNLLSLLSTTITTTTTTTTDDTSRPLFSLIQIKHLQLLSGIIARWSLGLNYPDPTTTKSELRLPNQFHTRFTELHQEVYKEERLKKIVKSLMRIIKRQEQEQLTSLILPNILLPLIASIFHLISTTTTEGEEFENDLVYLFEESNLTNTTSLLKLLLELVSLSKPLSKVRKLLTSKLESILLRRGGVRSLLILVIGLSSSQDQDDLESTTREKKLEMIWNLLAGVNHQSQSRRNIIDQLFEIIDTSTLSTISTTTSSTSSTPPPPSIVSSTSYLLIHFLLSSSPRHSQNYLISKFHSILLPNHYKLPPRTSSSTSTSLVVATHQDLKFFTIRLSILISNTPPHLIAKVLNKLLQPILPCLFSLLTFLSQKKKMKSEKSESENFKILKQQVESLVYVFGKTLSSSSSSSTNTSTTTTTTNQVDNDYHLVKTLGKVIESIENNQEFGQQTPGQAQEEGEGEIDEYEWRLSRVGGGVELHRRSLGIEEEEEEEEEIKLSIQEEDQDVEEGGGVGLSSLKIEPKIFIDWLTRLNQRELTCRMFLRWLEESRILRTSLKQQQQQSQSQEEDYKFELMKKFVIRLQLVLQMVEKFGSEILKEPNEIIQFIASILDIDESSSKQKKKKKRHPPEGGGGGNLRLDDLKFINHDQQEESKEEEEEEEEEEEKIGIIQGGEGREGEGGNDEMVLTGLTLLLSVLEANESLTISNTPLLLAIDSKLSSLSSSSTSTELIQPLIREAKTVLQLRETSLKFSSSSSTSTTSPSLPRLDGMESSREKYQQALKLLQDPLLPIRAQGLHLLKSLIKPNTDSDSLSLLKTDPALLPAILDIFLSSVQEEDSFVYLNAVQGLSLLVDVFGKQVINGLIKVYIGGGQVNPLNSSSGGQKELDTRLKIGEALIQVVQRLGTALPTLIDYLLPPLVATLRCKDLPVTLRSSSITILATMVETDPIGMMNCSNELGEVMRELLQIETVSYKKKSDDIAEKEEKKGKGVLIEEIASSDEDEEDLVSAFESLKTPSSSTTRHDRLRPEELLNPTITDSKHPTLRRAALLFLHLLIKTQIEQRYDLIEKFQQSQFERLGKSLIKDGKLNLPGSSSSQQRNTVINTRGGGGQEELGMGMGIGKFERKKLKITLRYLSETDRDELVRLQAGQVLEEMLQAGL